MGFGYTPIKARHSTGELYVETGAINLKPESLIGQLVIDTYRGPKAKPKKPTKKDFLEAMEWAYATMDLGDGLIVRIK
jgi:hypothetical protein